MNLNSKKIFLNDLKVKNIDSVIEEMKNHLEFYKKNPKYRNLAPFMFVYLKVTEKVKEKSCHKNFTDPAALEKLDIHFANLYFSPMSKFIKKDELTEPWNFYQYESQKNHHAFLMLLLGINTHINSDLLRCLYELNYDNEYDFLKINDLLMELIPEVLRYLFVEHFDLIGFAGIVFDEIALFEFREIIVGWRVNVWKTYKSMPKNLSKSEFEIFMNNVNKQIELLGESIKCMLTNPIKYSDLLKNLYSMKYIYANG
jgi:hypothetical protein